MRAYLRKMSYRPGCSCCNINKGLFGFHQKHGHPSLATKAAKRAGKKQMRQQSKRETYQGE